MFQLTAFRIHRRSGRSGVALIAPCLPWSGLSPVPGLSYPAIIGAMLGLIALPCAAQAPPDTGRLMQDQQRIRLPAPERRVALPVLDEPASPAAQVSQGLRVRVTAFRFSGNSALDHATLAALLADLIGKELSVTDLDAAAARITASYRQRGYFIASAYLPAQDIQGGVVEVTILEGNLGKLTVANRSAVSDRVVRAMLPDLQPGRPLKQDTLERSLLLLNGLPGVEVRSTVTPGASLGATDLDIRVESQARIGGTISVDDYGNRFSGAARLGTQLNANSPLGLGDALSLRATASDARFRYARLAYQLPVGGAGLQLGGAWSTMRYRLGLDFAALQAHGIADIGSVYALYPLQRSRLANVNLQANFERKHLDDRTDSTGSRSDKTVGALTLGVSGDQLDSTAGGAFTAWSLAYAGGSLRLDPQTQALDASGHRTQGRYDKMSLQLSRQQRFGGAAQAWGWSGQLSGQVAGRNLDSSEKFSLGGAQGVRAYPQGEAACDDAWLASVELNYALGSAWQLAGFVDRAAGRLDHAPVAADTRQRQRLAGAGVAASYRGRAGLSVAATLAWRGSGAPVSDRDRSPRLWMQAQQYF